MRYPLPLNGSIRRIHDGDGHLLDLVENAVVDFGRAFDRFNDRAFIAPKCRGFDLDMFLLFPADIIHRIVKYGVARVSGARLNSLF